MTAVVMPMALGSSRDKADVQALALPEALWDLVPVALYVCDLQGRIVRFNRRAAELWGREPNLLESNDDYCGSFRLYPADGRWLPLAECAIAEVLPHGDSLRD